METAQYGKPAMQCGGLFCTIYLIIYACSGDKGKVEHRSGDSQEAAVEAVQKAAMTRQDMAAVLDAHLSLHLTFHQITPCAEHDHNQGEAQPHGQTVARRYPMPACHRGQQSEDAASDAAYPRLAGRHTGEQLPGEPAVKELPDR